MANEGQRLLVFVGSYAEAEENGVYAYAFDEELGTLTLLDQYAGIKNPTFLNVDADRNRLYAICETLSPEGQRIGAAASFAIDPASGTISLLNRQHTTDGTTCHIQRDAESRYLTVTSYGGGMIGLSRIAEDGSIGEVLDVRQHEGRSVHPERQDRPHPHSSLYSPDGNYLYVQDLGLDRIVTYAVRDGKLERLGETELHPGAGPRHLSFHPNGRYAYVINEVDSTITAFTYDAASGRLDALGTVSTLPAEFEGENTCAEIAVSKDGKFVYGSNRGHDSIVVYAVDEKNGTLNYVQHASVEGGHPRHFALTPSGRYLLAANRDTNNIAAFAVDRDSGELRYTGKSTTVSKPVCVMPVYFKI
ncbi:lactonase family protein [Paenibacillus arenilitoris]|uniref:Lactonase family protein n=1 Tax=Paenibacillus arenilitoris TaxID=2772299 RepID=A0A927CLS6_9BACL|nr:lactonase family protein [Paenibacillus arenilitoris]MBD2869760.1 lactonase family protein [Paenibacillus arenilitoris]